METDIVEISKRVNELAGIKVPIHNNMPTQNASKVEQRISLKESDTGLAPPALWDLAADKQSLQSEQPLQVGKLNLSSIDGDLNDLLLGRAMHKDHQRRLG